MVDLRAATADDELLILRWRNEASVRAASFDTAEISREQHHVWFARMLSDPNCTLFIIEEDGSPIGQVRLDRAGPDVAEVSIALDPDARGKGIGREALRRLV